MHLWAFTLTTKFQAIWSSLPNLLNCAVCGRLALQKRSKKNNMLIILKISVWFMKLSPDITKVFLASWMKWTTRHYPWTWNFIKPHKKRNILYTTYVSHRGQWWHSDNYLGCSVSNCVTLTCTKTVVPQPADIRTGFKTIYVYTDIIKCQRVGDSFLPLLRCSHIDGINK